MSLTTEYPFGFAFLCLLLAAAGSWFLYRNNPLRLEGLYRRYIQIGLTALRFLSIFLISFLLLGPLLNLVMRKVEKPVVVIALDNSQSIINNKDSSLYKGAFIDQLHAFKKDLEDDYDVKWYLVGSDLRKDENPNYKEKQTNLSLVFDEVNDRFSTQNLGAIVLASDGLYNTGNNPLYAAKNIQVPTFTVALGDTNQHKDLLIKNVRHNQLVYAGNSFPLQVDVMAFMCQNSNTQLKVIQNGQVLQTKNISINSSRFFESVTIELNAKQEGTQHYTLLVSPLPGEATTANNRFDVFINVINSKQKVLILGLTPHPDLAAMAQSIESNENYSVKVLTLNHADEIGKPENYDLVIVHQLPGWRGEGLSQIKQFNEKRIPLLAVIGSQTGLNYLSAFNNVLTISTNKAAVNEALPLYNNNFSLFSLTDEDIANFKKLPPLVSPFGNYKINAESDVLFTQQIGYVKTNYPLVFFNKGIDNHFGFICGEGFWKWRLYDFSISKQQTTNMLMSKTIQYLVNKKDQSRFRINGKKRFDETERIIFDAEVYNESYELINTPEVSINVRDSKGKLFTYVFSKTEKSYNLDMGIMPPGNYSYEASATINNKTEKAKGSFAVLPSQLEFMETSADHQLLNELATSTGGKLFYPGQLNELKQTLQQSEHIKPVIYKQEELKNWLNLKWLFFIMLGLLTTEWFIRRWNGSI